jgi:hypothetical protein
MFTRKMVFPFTVVLFILSLIWIAFPAPLAAQGQAAGGAADRIALPLDEENAISLSKLIEFTSEVQRIAILHDECEAGDERFQFTSRVEVPRDAFQGYFERLLLDKGFLFFQSGPKKSAIYRVIRMPGQRSNYDLSLLKSAALMLDMDDLDAFADRGILVTVSVPLKSLNSRMMLQSLNPYFMNNYVESVRSTETGNSLIMTTVAQKAVQIARLLQKMDREAPEREILEPSRRIEALEQQIAILEKRIKSLEKLLEQKTDK